mgnify:CR=1 FL=1
MTTIPADLLNQYADFVQAHEYRSSETAKMKAQLPLQFDSRGRVYLGYWQDAWADVSYYWEPQAEIKQARRCSEPTYFPLCGGRLARQVTMIGD